MSKSQCNFEGLGERPERTLGEQAPMMRVYWAHVRSSTRRPQRPRQLCTLHNTLVLLEATPRHHTFADMDEIGVEIQKQVSVRGGLFVELC